MLLKACSSVDRHCLRHALAEPSGASLGYDSRLSRKVRDACAFARRHGHRYLWIDSCCIDKTSSSELSESINSMFQWYAGAAVCYTFLADVPSGEGPDADGSRFRLSRWFTRGWTLQELVAPSELLFLSSDWEVIGSKRELATLVETVSGVDREALLREKPLNKFSVAQRFSWAAQRQTTRIEDRAYSLLGIFGINMPTLYGEGEGALRRLQEEIMRRIPDQSLFAWQNVYVTPKTPQDQTARRFECKVYREEDDVSLLAPSLDVFNQKQKILTVPHNDVGYTIDLQVPDWDHQRVHVLRLSNDEHVVAVEYEHTLQKHGVNLTIRARVTMASRASHVSDVQANPGAVHWADFKPWNASLNERSVSLTAAGAQVLVVKLGLDFAGPSCYRLRVDVVR
ncbi:hypothetical protein V8D89_013166 [Ganoderma adspersum]